MGQVKALHGSSKNIKYSYVVIVEGLSFTQLACKAKGNINVLIAISCFADVGPNQNDPSTYAEGSKVWNVVSGLGIEPCTYNVQCSYVGSIITYVPSGSGSITNANGMK